MAYLDSPFQQRINADLASVFFREFAEQVELLDSANLLTIIFEQNVEVLNEMGTLDIVAYAITALRGSVQREQLFARNQRRWRVGRVLERSPDGLIETWEVSPDGSLT